MSLRRRAFLALNLVIIACSAILMLASEFYEAGIQMDRSPYRHTTVQHIVFGRQGLVARARRYRQHDLSVAWFLIPAGWEFHIWNRALVGESILDFFEGNTDRRWWPSFTSTRICIPYWLPAALSCAAITLLKIRRRNPNHCPKCHYNLTGLPPKNTTCPECGHAAPTPTN